MYLQLKPMLTQALSPALNEYLQTLVSVWQQTGDTSDETIATILNIQPESVRQRRQRLYDQIVYKGQRDIPNLLHHALKLDSCPE